MSERKIQLDQLVETEPTATLLDVPTVLLLLDEPGDDGHSSELLFPGLRPDIVRRDISRPIDPVPGSGPGEIFQEVFNRPERQVALAVCSPVARLPAPPFGGVRVITAAQRLLAVGGAASSVLLSFKKIK